MKAGLSSSLATLQVPVTRENKGVSGCGLSHLPHNYNSKTNNKHNDGHHSTSHDNNNNNNSNNNNNNNSPSLVANGKKKHINHHHQNALNQLQKSAGTPSVVSILKDTVHSVVGALLGCEHDDQRRVQPSRYTRQEVSNHCRLESCWIVINNLVYDVTRFLRTHPGGQDILLEHGGHDATSAFIDKGHSVYAFDMMGDCCIGEIALPDRYPYANHT